MTIDPRTPVIIGVRQVSGPAPDPERLTEAPDAIDLMAEAVRGAAADTSATTVDVLAATDLIAVVGGLWRHRNPGAMIAGPVGASRARGLLTTFGGNTPIELTHALAERIRAGELDMAVVTGGEANLTRRALAAQGQKPVRRGDPPAEEVESWGAPLAMGDATAIERGGEIPRNSYAVLDSAIRAARGETLDAARDDAARLWAGLAAAAVDNPHAADRRGLDAASIREPGPGNRMVAWPYTKAMCANNHVDQAAALVVCATAVADRLGVPADRRVHLHHCVTAQDTPTLLERDDVATAPALDAAAAAITGAVGGVDRIDHVDLYTCFPAIVRLTTAALGLDPSRTLTIGGGLAFAGAPLNFAAGQSLVAMVDALRRDPGTFGLVQGNGGHATKHAFGLYSTEPPDTPHEVTALGTFGRPRHAAPPDHHGTGVIAGATVEYDHAGPTRAVVLVTLDDGRRCWANSDDPSFMGAIVTEETVGRPVTVAEGRVSGADRSWP